MQKSTHSAYLLLIATLFVAPPILNAQEKSASEQQFVLLTNGQVISGFVSRESGNVIVQVPNGSRLLIQQTNVDTVCDNLVDAYWQKAARTKATDLDGQSKLFHWCIGNGLLDQAQNQIDIISLMKIDASELEYLHRQLTVAFDSRSKRIAKMTELAKEFSNLPSPSEDTTKTSVTTPVASGGDFEPRSQEFASRDTQSTRIPQFKIGEMRQLPSLNSSIKGGASSPIEPSVVSNNASEIKLVGYAQPVKEAEAQGVDIEDPDAKKPKLASVEELDALVKSLPKPAVAMFKRKIEPLLVRSCYLAGCHRNSAKEMPLTRLAKGQLIPRRLSQRNLDSIMKYTDPNHPLESRLLAAAMKAHGGLEEPIIEQGTVQFNNLANWLIAISNQPNAKHEMPARDEMTRSLPPIASSDEEQEEFDSVIEPEQKTESLDRHDPARFNRQFLKRDE